MTWITLALFTLQPVLAAAEAVADTKAPAANRPSVEKAQNGTPIVQIVKPTAGGVSRNLFDQFDITRDGLILNNSYNLSKTQLAGYIQGNANLAGGSARIILNEVTGKNISNLRGFLEVAGQKADVIIANRNGIVGNGFGFINTNRGVLTTGVPVFGGSGSLEAFRVTDGDIDVQGDGINANGADRVDLISRAVNVNAGIWAKELNAVTGSNDVNYETLATNKIEGEGIQPQVAIDVSALGGMYANKIRLVGTEQGVGVNSQGTLSATSGNLVLTNDGKIALAGKLNASGNVDIKASDDITNQGTIFAQGNTTIDNSTTLTNTGMIAATQNVTVTSKSIASTGTLAAGANSDGTIGQIGNLTVTATDTLQATGKNLAGADLTMTAQSMDLSGAKTYVSGVAKLTATNGEINHVGGTLEANKVQVTAASLNNQAGQIKQSGTDDTYFDLVGTLDNQNGQIVTNAQKFNIQAGALINDQGSLQQAGTGNLTFNTNGDFSNAGGNVASNGIVNIATQNLNNEGGTIAGVKTNVAAAALNNQQGKLQANDGLDVTAQFLDNQSGQIVNNNTGNTNIIVTLELKNQSGTIGGKEAVNVSAQKINNQGGQITAQTNLNVTAGQDIDNTDGKLSAEQDAQVMASHLNNSLGTVAAGNNLVASATTITNDAGTLQAQKDVTLTTQNLGGGGTVLAGQDIKIVSSGDFEHGTSGKIQANRNLDVTAVGAIKNRADLIAKEGAKISANNISNSGMIASGSDLTIQSGTDINNSGRLDGNKITINAGNLTNSGTVIGSEMLINSANLTNSGASAILASTGNITLNVRNSLVNQDDATIYSAKDITIAGSSNLDDKGILLDRTVSILNQGSTIQAEGNVTIYANEVTNKADHVTTTETVVSDNVYNQFLGEMLYYDAPDYAYNLNAYDRTGHEVFTSYFTRNGHIIDEPHFVAREKITETRLSSNYTPGEILAGNNMLLQAGTVTNDSSHILAGGTLNSGKSTINNISTALVRTIVRHVVEAEDNELNVAQSLLQGIPSPTSEDNRIAWYVEREYDVTTHEQITGTTALFGGGQSVVINGPSVNNVVKSPVEVPNGNLSSLPSTSGSNVQTVLENKNSMKLPTNGLYTLHTEPTSRYLIETDSRFANLGNFVSSDYMLNQLSIDPEKTMKLVGDGFYQQKLVREQITQLTGREMLTGYSSSEEEYKALLTNGAVYAKQFNLEVGVALTQEQMAQLTSNMVWLVEQEVNGQKVLVPVVYTAHVTSGNVTPNGSVISGDSVQITSSGDVTNSGTISAKGILDITAQNIANQGGAISGDTTVNLKATTGDIINQNGTISGNQVALDAGRDIKSETVTTTSTIDHTTVTKAVKQATITSVKDLTLKSGQDITLNGVLISAGTDLTVNAGRNISVGTVIEEEKRDYTGSGKNRYIKDEKENITTGLLAGGNLSISSTQDTTLKGAQVSAENNLSIKVGGNLNIGSVKDEVMVDSTQGRSSNWKRTRTDDETVIGSNLVAGNDVTISAVKENDKGNAGRGNIVISGSSISSLADSKTDTLVVESVFAYSKANDIGTNDTQVTSTVLNGSGTVSNTETPKTSKVNIIADNNITIQEVKEKHESLEQTHKKTSGFLSSTTKDTLDYSLVNKAIGSSISGDAVNIDSGKDLTIKGSNVVGTNDVTLNGDNDVTITSAQETGKDEHYKRVKKSGLFSGGGLGFTIGSQETKTTLKEQVKDEIGSTVGSVAGNVKITAGNNVKSEGTTMASGNDLEIKGKDVTIGNTINTYDSQYKYEFKQTGLTVSVSGGVVDTALNAFNEIQRAGEVQDSRLAALYDYKALKDLNHLKDAVKGGDLTKGVGINVSFGSTSTSIEQNTHIETVNTSNINVGGNVTITSTEKDIDIKGTQINATDITLDAKQDLNITAAQNKQETNTKTDSSSWSIGGTIGVGYSGNYSNSNGKENGNTIVNTGSVLNASGTMDIRSGNDTNITGSKVIGDKVVANIAGDLNIESTQDRDNYTAKNKSVGIGISTERVDGKPLPEGVSGPVNKVTSVGVIGTYNTSKTDSTYKSVTEQAGIYAGKNGFDIIVDKNTDLKGAVISSEATADKNTLITDSLSWSDIRNKAEYEANSSGINISTKDGKLGMPTPNLSVPVSGDANSTTNSAISPATIIVRNGNTDISQLSRDTEDALNALGKIFDKKTVQEQQELAKVFGEEAFKAVGDLAESMSEKATTPEEKAKWAEGGEYKIILHALVGGLLSELSGNGFASGSVSGGVTQGLQKELAKITDPGMRLLLSSLVGEAASKLAGGNAPVGGGIGYTGTKYNDYGHKPTYEGAIIYTQKDGYCQMINGEYVKMDAPPPSGVYVWVEDPDNPGYGGDYKDNVYEKDKIIWQKFVTIDEKAYGITLKEPNSIDKKNQLIGLAKRYFSAVLISKDSEDGYNLVNGSGGFDEYLKSILKTYSPHLFGK